MNGCPLVQSSNKGDAASADRQETLHASDGLCSSQSSDDSGQENRQWKACGPQCERRLGLGDWMGENLSSWSRALAKRGVENCDSGGVSQLRLSFKPTYS